MNPHQLAAATQPHTNDWADGDRYEAFMGRWSRPIATEFVRWLDIAAGGVWLDVGCGTGPLTAAVCRFAAPLSVTGVDASSEYVEHAADLDVCEVAGFEVADAAALPFDDGIFDVAVSGLLLNFLPDPVASLREQSRVVSSWGTVAAYVWDYAAGMRLLRHFWDAARATVPSAVAFDEAVRFRGASPDALMRSFEAAGLDAIETVAIEVEGSYRTFAELWTPFLSGQGPAPGFVAGLDVPTRAALQAAFEERLPVGSDGRITLTARAWAARGRV